MEELLGIDERTAFDLSLNIEKPVWSMNFAWSESGIETPITEPAQMKYASELLNASERLSLAHEFLNYLDDELAYSRSRWNKHPTVEFVETENIIEKEIDDNIIPGERLSFRLNELEDGFFWGIRAWSSDDWGNIPKGLSQQDIQNRIERDDLVSSDGIKMELSLDSVFKGWSLKLWNKNGWIKFEQPAEEQSTHQKTESELLVVKERAGFESILSLDPQTDFINTKSRWSELAW